MRAEMGKYPTRSPPSQLNLPPGFRFYPTDEELVVHYLCKKAASEPFAVPIIADIELYKFDPWDLPERALFGEKEWYFFSPRDRKYPNGSRPNRAAGTGYWKATGTDKPISTMGGSKKVGVKKALVFYEGKPPKGVKTNWIMHEYCLAESAALRASAKRKSSGLRLDDWVLCRIYKKSTSAAAQTKLGSNADIDVKAEQSESSCLDDVLATLSELDDPTHEVPATEAEDAHTDMQPAFFQTQSSLGDLYQGPGSQYLSTDLRAYMRELQDKAEMPTSQQVYAAVTNYEMRQQHASTPESIMSSRQHSPLESYSTSGQQEEEDLTVDSTINALSSLPLTQLLTSSINTQNLSFQANPLYGLDFGLPSPCTMLAQGAPFGGGSLIDPDNYLFQPSNLGWDATRVNYSS